MTSHKLCRAFGILVRRWGILWRPLEVAFHKLASVVNVLMNLHNFCIDAGQKEMKENEVLEAGYFGLSFHAGYRQEGDVIHPLKARALTDIDTKIKKAPSDLSRRGQEKRAALTKGLAAAGLHRPATSTYTYE